MTKKNTPQITEGDLREIRCSHCGRFLGMEYIMIGIVKIKCPNCKMFTVLIGERTNFESLAELVGAKDLTNNKEPAKIRM